MYVRGYLQGSENGRVVTIETYMVSYDDVPRMITFDLELQIEKKNPLEIVHQTVDF